VELYQLYVEVDPVTGSRELVWIFGWPDSL
jgi:hypothetical protein